MAIRTFKTYQEMDKAHREDVSSFPICWMFGRKTDDEIKQILNEELGVNSLSECLSIDGGGIIRKADKDAFLRMFKNHDAERKLFMKDEKNLVSMIVSEMNNHEYSYTGDFTDTRMALGWTVKQINSDPVLQRAIKKAHKICMENA